MFVSGVWEEPLSAIIEKQSLTEDEEIPQEKKKKKKKVKIPSHLSRETSKGKHTYTKSKHESDAM